MNKSVKIFTIVARNYLAQAFVLGNSVKRDHPDADFLVFLIDDINHAHEEEIKNKELSVIYPEDISIPYFKQFVYKYSVVEACTAIKPLVMEYLLQTSNKVIYLDPDILCFRRFDEVLEALDHYSIVITPHSISPHNHRSFVSDRAHLISGAYNLGFIAVSKGKTTSEFLTWWENHLMEECLVDSCPDLFVDQKWIDLVPSYFNNVLVFKNPAYNIAYWNLHERFLEKEGGKYCLLPSKELVAFIHFSGFKSEDIIRASMCATLQELNSLGEISSIPVRNRPDFMEPFSEYVKLLVAEDFEKYCKLPYEFITYSNGEVISPLERILFLKSSEWQKMCLNPFEVAGKSFWSFCRGRGIKSKTSPRTTERDEIRLKRNSVAPRKGGLNRIIECMAKYIIRSGIKIMIRIFGVGKYLKIAGFCVWQFQLVNHDFLLNEKKELVKNESNLKKVVM